ncbi:MAG: GHKL domain-containing protein [Candidatus Glassbacteria bacterium]|nr:GHKL domain-containing protein [Candidatus Glassbacteria bacterium]
MDYKNFRAVCIVRVVLLCATIFLASYLVIRTSYYATITILAGLVVFQAIALINYIEKTNQYLTRFLQAIRHEDFSQSFTGKGLGASFDQLRSAYNEVLDAFRRTRAEKEEHFRYLQTVVQHVGVGLICYGPNGEVELINTAAQRILKTGQLRNIESLAAFSKELADTLQNIAPGGKSLVRVAVEGEILYLAIHATELRLRSQPFTLVSIQNIQSELDDKEMEAWQNLARVLSHEIMNSITPISSLAATANNILQAADSTAEETIKPETLRDIRDAVQTIHKRSEGLLNFVENYRKITRLPKPEFQTFPVVELFERIRKLMQSEIEKKDIAFQVKAEIEGLKLTADPDLIEQVIINLLRNSVDAVKDRPDARIDLTARADSSGRPLIQVTDNGPGIEEDIQEKIFIPFFTTKKEGSGIGLSLSQQIMRLHRGNISVQLKQKEHTSFVLRF